MIRLNLVLKYKYIILLLIIIYALIINNNLTKTSKYSDSVTVLTGIVDNIKEYKDYLRIELNAKEKVIVKYFFKKNEIVDISLGDCIKVEGTIEKIRSLNNFNIFNYAKYMNNKEIFYSFKANSLNKIKDNDNIIYFIKNIVNKRIDNIKLSSGYIRTFLIGDKKNIEEEVLDSYSVNGIIHLFSISGMHISLFVLILNKLLNRFKFKNILIIIFLIFYMIITNFLVGVIRSGLMYIALLINKKTGSRLKTIDMLVFLGMIMIVLKPNYIRDVGFLFSFIVTYFLLYSSDLINSFKSYYTNLLFISYIAFLAGLPILIYNFSTVNFLSILLNIIFVPLVSFVILPLSIILFISNIDLIDSVLYFFINLMENISMFVDNYKISFSFSKLDLWVYILYYVIIIFVINMYKKGIKRYTIILLLLLCIHYNNRVFNFNTEITFIDVGQGDCTLISYPNNSLNILVDTGGNLYYDLASEVVIPYLNSIGIKKLDYLILTHGDYDHMGASSTLLETYKVDNILINSSNNNKLELDLLGNYSKIITMIDKNSRLNIKNNIIDIYTYASSDENHNSLITMFYLNNYKILLTGDASVNEELKLLDYIDDVDILKVGHHGSNTSSSKKFVDTISPKYSIISAGYKNRYHHPSKKVLDTLKDSLIYRTDMNGMIKFVFNKKDVSIFPYLHKI